MNNKLNNELSYNFSKQDYYSAVQLTLPVDISYSVDIDDPVRTFMEVMGGLNLNKYFKKSRRGREGYNDAILLKIVLFAYMENIRSLRDIEKACRTDIRFMWLSNGLKPSHMAFQRFISDRLIKEIDLIFYEINSYLIEKENINTNVLYVDGTKIEANARKFSFVWKKAILNYQAKLFLKITKELETMNQLPQYNYQTKERYEPKDLSPIYHALLKDCMDKNIQFVYGKGTRKSIYQRHFEKVKEYHDKLEEYEEHLQICGERGSYSKTDHDATFMHGKEDYYNKTGIFKPYYNLQIGVSDEYILHMGISPNPTDTKTWVPFFESYKSRYHTLPEYPVADAGYGSYDNYMYCVKNNMKLYMKYNNYSKEKEPKFKKKLYNIKNMTKDGNQMISQDGLRYIYSHDINSRYTENLSISQRYEIDASQIEIAKEKGAPKSVGYNPVLMEFQETAFENLESEKGIKLRTNRSYQAEGVFGDIKHNMEYERIQRRGKQNVENELYLVCIGYNLRKFHNKKYRN